MTWYQFLSNPGNLPTVAILAICSVAVVGALTSALVKVVKLVVVHRERMARIEHGFDPDAPPLSDPESATARMS